MMIQIKMCFGVVFILFASLTSIHAEQVRVVIKNGPIIGQQISVLEHSVNQFLGIPYAQPPIGKLRFHRPVPAEPWKHPLQAVEWPNNCIQTLVSPEVTAWYFNKNFTEDCLYLNIWSPDVNVDEENLRPVLVWIHGGGFLTGSNSLVLYDGKTLSSMADAVIVTINYRLSSLGFLYSDEVPDVKGNQGFWDQTLALEWVNENIRYFGGDPSQITIFGESAGSCSVSALILSPASRNLFHNAILMSGSAVFAMVDSAEEMVTKQLKGIRAVGCATDSDKSITKKVIECLQNLEPEQVDQIYYKSSTNKFHPVGVVDKEFFPVHPNQMLSDGDHKKNFNLLVSTVEDEGTPVFTYLTQDLRFRPTNPESLTLKAAQDLLYGEVVKIFLKHTPTKSLIDKIYFNSFNPNLDHSNQFRKQVGVAYGNFYVTCPTIHFCKSLFGNSPETIKVYQWYYTAKLVKPSPMCPEWTGPCHTDDLQPLFGMPFYMPQMYVNRMRDISREVINFIKSFIRIGTPGEEHSEWQSYFIGADELTVVAPYYELSNQPKSHLNFMFDLKRTECDFWSHYYE